MSLELVREAIKVNRAISQEATQTVIENDIIVPDTKPDISRILLLDGDTHLESTEITDGEIQVKGAVRYNILYIADDDERSIKSINSSSAFEYSFDMPNIKPGMNCRVKCSVEHADYEILNGRKINIKAILAFEGKAASEEEYFAVSDIKGLDGVQILRKNMPINYSLGSSEYEFEIKELVEVPLGKPSIREILRNDVKIVDKDYKAADNKVIVKGAVNVSTLYIADDEARSVQFMEYELPFTQFVDLDEMTEDAACEVYYRIGDYRLEAAEDSDGELRNIISEIGIKAEVSGYAKRNTEIIADAFSTRSVLNLEKETFTMEDYPAESKSQVMLKETIVIDEESPGISEIFNVLSKPALTGYRIEDNKVTIEGVVKCSALYLANDSEQPIVSYEQEVPLRHTVEMEGIHEGMSCDIDLDMVHCNYSMISSDEIEIRLAVGANVRVIDEVTATVVGKVNELPLDDKRAASRPSITIYFTQPGDTLWNVAKRYHITMEDIRSFNGLGENEEIEPGQQIMIPRQKV